MIMMWSIWNNSFLNCGCRLLKLENLLRWSFFTLNNDNDNNNNIFTFTAQMQKGFQMRLTMKYLNYIYRKKINTSKYNVKIQLTITITETISRQWLNSVTAFHVMNILLIIIFKINIVDLIVTSVHPHPSIHLSGQPSCEADFYPSTYFL